MSTDIASLSRRIIIRIGRVYEYFLKEFAVNATKEEGEFYTPHDVVQLIATLIEPFDGTLYEIKFSYLIQQNETQMAA